MHHHHGRHHGHFHFMGRHGRGHGFRAFAGLMGNGLGGRSFHMGRKLAAGGLQLLILSLLAEKPRHGYEIIKELEERSSGFYAPSPGMVYPALTYIEEIGYATVEAEGAKKLYRITEAGRAHLEENREAVDAIIAQLAHVGRRMARVRDVFAADEESGDESDKAAIEMVAARRGIKAALAEKYDANPEEQRRIAQILKRAADEIRGK